MSAIRLWALKTSWEYAIRTATGATSSPPPPPPPASNAILMESGNYILLEDGSKILLE